MGRESTARDSERKKLYELLENHPDYPSNYAATDYGETIVSTEELNMSIPVNDNDGRTNTFIITKVAEILPEKLREHLEGRKPPYNQVGQKRGYNPAPALQALQIILAKCPSNSQDVLQAYRKRYFPTGGPPEWTENARAGAVAMKGFRFSVRPTVGGLLCNINVSGTNFYKEGLLTDLIAECLGMNDEEIQHLTLSQIQIVFEYYDPLQGLAREMNMEEYFSSGIAPKSTFSNLLNFVWFYYIVRNIRLQYPQLPCVLVGQGTVERPIPMEILRVVGGQRVRVPTRLLDLNKHFCRPPASAAQTVAEFGLYFWNDVNNAYLSNFGISVSNHMAIIPARVLSAPTLTYENKAFSPSFGSWNLVDAKLASGGTVTSWAVLFIDHEARGAVKEVPNFITAVDNFRVKCAEIGLVIGPCDEELSSTVRMDQYRYPVLRDLRPIQRRLSQMAGNVTFVLVILTFHDDDIYSEIKYLGDTQCGVITACMKWHMLSMGKSQYISNVALKLNLKLGGTNHEIQNDCLGSLRNGKRMIVGCRVAHRSPSFREYSTEVDDSQPNFQSIAGVVASMDGQFNLYPASFRVQKRMETIQDLKWMMIERLQQWSRMNNGTWPDSVVIYRSGICESQVALINKLELPQIRRSFKECGAGSKYKPNITIIIVSKNHHTRFYPTSVENADRTGNVTPGTVEDRAVASPHSFSFFLQSHAATGGTARPAYYQVVYDDNNFVANDIQKLTHNLCYLYGRATKSIAVCAPVRYAELMCKRGALYASVCAVSDDHERTATEVSVHARLKDTMFYI
ncbi:Piwi-domain-containing protein [Wilcoxina mikolae CBS 423.85]|nr:Piwi-domain-containing protein [Wilcoxina mikolae CBS 423.85]